MLKHINLFIPLNFTFEMNGEYYVVHGENLVPIHVGTSLDAAERAKDTFSKTGKRYDYKIVGPEEAEEIRKEIDRNSRRIR